MTKNCVFQSFPEHQTIRRRQIVVQISQIEKKLKDLDRFERFDFRYARRPLVLAEGDSQKQKQ